MTHDLIDIALNEVKASAGEAFIFPESLYKHIAFRMTKENCIGNKDWLSNELAETRRYVEHKRELAERGGYQPFTFMGKSAYLWIRKNCADWVLPAMEKAFKDPEDIHPEWAVQCAKTMSIIGKEICDAQPNLYDYLIAHPEWEIQKDAREQYRKEWIKLKRNWEQKQDPNGRYSRHGDSRRHPRDHNSDNRRPYNQRSEPRPVKLPATYQILSGSSETQTAPQVRTNPSRFVEASCEVVVKFDKMPRGRPAQDRDWTNFELFAAGQTVSVEIRRSFYDKLLQLTKEGKSWLAVLSGQMALTPGQEGFAMNRPFGHIYETNKSSAEESQVKALEL